MEFLEKLSQRLTLTLTWISGVLLGFMTLMACANVLLRTVWVPLRGTFEMMGYFCAVVNAFALGYTQLRKGHIAVDILIMRFRRPTQRALTAINSLLCTLFFAGVTWQIAKYATTLWRTGEVTETLRIAYFPFTYGVALGCGILSLVFLVDFLKSVVSSPKEAG
jgi:TRAP-type C4-dicarboxylate transport system permease small subunit